MLDPRCKFLNGILYDFYMLSETLTSFSFFCVGVLRLFTIFYETYVSPYAVSCVSTDFPLFGIGDFNT